MFQPSSYPFWLPTTRFNPPATCFNLSTHLDHQSTPSHVSDLQQHDLTLKHPFRGPLNLPHPFWPSATRFGPQSTSSDPCFDPHWHPRLRNARTITHTCISSFVVFFLALETRVQLLVHAFLIFFDFIFIYSTRNACMSNMLILFLFIPLEMRVWLPIHMFLIFILLFT